MSHLHKITLQGFIGVTVAKALSSTKHGITKEHSAAVALFGLFIQIHTHYNGSIVDIGQKVRAGIFVGVQNVNGCPAIGKALTGMGLNNLNATIQRLNGFVEISQIAAGA